METTLRITRFCGPVLAGACAVIVAGISARAELITNGSFDTDLSGWSTFGRVDFNGGLKVSFGGGGDNRGGIYQELTTVAGEWYRVSYDKGYAGYNYVSDVSLTLFDGAGNSDANAFSGSYYRGYSGSGITAWFQARSTTTTIQFRDYS